MRCGKAPEVSGGRSPVPARPAGVVSLLSRAVHSARGEHRLGAQRRSLLPRPPGTRGVRC